MSERDDKSSGLHVWQLAKKHPYATSGIVFVVGAVLIYLYYSGQSSAPAAAQQGTGGSDQSYLQAQLQSEAIQAQEAAQQSQVTAAANAATSQINGQVSVAQLNDQAAIDVTNSNNTVAEQIAALQAALGTTQSNNQTTVQDLATETQGGVDMAQIQAGTEQAQISSQTQIALGAQSTGVVQTLLQGIFGSNTQALQEQNQQLVTQVNNQDTTFQTLAKNANAQSEGYQKDYTNIINSINAATPQFSNLLVE